MNLPFTMAADGLERHRFSTSDVDRMIDAGVLEAQGRWELLDGEIVPMAAQHMPHARMANRLDRLLAAKLSSPPFEVFSGATVELSSHTRVDPDIFVARAGIATKIGYAADVLWVIEISDSTRRRDLKVKAPLYAAAGVPELWVVDLENEITHIHREPSASGWNIVRQAAFAETIAPTAFPDLKLSISAL